MKRTVAFSMLVIIIVLGAEAYGGDSPRFRGPAGDGIFPEIELLKTWPDGGPKLTWSVKGLGKGFCSPTIVNETVYVTGMDDKKEGYLFAFTLNGSLKWKTAYGPEMGQTGPARPGTRATTAVDGNRVHLMSSFGKLITFDATTGKVLRTIDLLERFGAGQAKFGFAECVQVDGNKIICTPGGLDASLVALDKKTGETIWQTKGLSQPPAYCAARIINHGGKQLLVTMVEKALVAVDPDTGKVLWQYDYPQRFGVQPNPPLYADGMIYICSGGGKGGAMLELSDDGQSVTEKWTDQTLDCQMHGVVVIDG